MILLALLSLTSALAGERVPVLVSALQPRNEESAQLAVLIEAFVAEKLADRPELRLLRIEDSPPFEDYSARVYVESCPPGEIVGCTFVIGERVEAAWAVTGTVKSLVKGTTVDIDVVDVKGSRVAVSFRSELESGRDEAFAEGVARVLVAAIEGEVGREEDIRKGADPDEETDPQDDEAIARELEALSKELGEFTTTIRRSNVGIERPRLTAEDIAEKSEEEGSKPWERLGMTPTSYLQYKNSGLDLPTWRGRAEGRRFQLLLRAGGGFMNGPVDMDYYGRYSVQGVQTVDAYAAQSVESGSTGVGVVAVGFGVHPLVDVAVQVGTAGGRFDYLISQEVVDAPVGELTPTSQGQTNLLVGPRVTVALLPISSFRPTFGFGAYWMQGSHISEVIIPPDELARFEAQPTWNVEVFGGGEARLGDHLDLWLQVPVSFLVAGDTVQELRTTTVSTLEGLQSPAGASAVGVSVLAGVQVRLFGSKPQATSTLDETDD